MGKQTTVQEATSIRFGSGKIEAGEAVESLLDIGAMRNIQFEETWDKVRVMSDNAGEVDVGIRNHRAAIQGDMMEINTTNLNMLRGGIDNYSTVAGSLVSGATQSIPAGSWALNQFIKIANQNHDLGEISINSVVGNSTAYTADTDYVLVQDVHGHWGIIVLDTVTTDVAHNLVIDYDYTPASAKKLTSGGKVSISPRIIRVTNYNEEGKKFQITIYKARVEEGINIELQPDEGEDPATNTIRLQGGVDRTRDAGDQLFEILDEQAV